MQRGFVHRERTLEMAHAFVEEFRRDLESSAREECDVPPRLRTAHTRVGHATPEYRTVSVPATAAGAQSSPDLLSSLISRYAANRRPCCALLALEALSEGEGGEAVPLLIAEARDSAGTRMYLMQPFRRVAGVVRWEEPLGGGWRDPRDEEMILDAAFASGAGAGMSDPA